MSNKKAKGIRGKTRQKFRRKVREKTTVNEIIKPVKIDDIVHIDVVSSYHMSMPHKRMQGKTGKVIKMQGKVPVVRIKDGNKTKDKAIHPVHLKIFKSENK